MLVAASRATRLLRRLGEVRAPSSGPPPRHGVVLLGGGPRLHRLRRPLEESFARPSNTHVSITLTSPGASRGRMLCEFRAGDAAHPIAFGNGAEVDESGKAILEAEVDCHCRVLSSGKKAPRGCPEPGQAGDEALGVLDAALNAAEACHRTHLLDDVDAVVIA